MINIYNEKNCPNSPLYKLFYKSKCFFDKALLKPIVCILLSNTVIDYKCVVDRCNAHMTDLSQMLYLSIFRNIWLHNSL